LITFPRSRMYKIEPIGVGTSRCESLTSYIYRIAIAHNFQTGHFIKEVLAKESSNLPDQSSWRNEDNSDGNQYLMNGLGINAETRVNQLQQLIDKTNLQCLTMLPWKTLISKEKLIRKNYYVCPICIDKQNITSDFYIPLAWYINPVTICNIHEVKLLTGCPYCHKKFSLHSVASRFGCCPSCTRYLGSKIYGINENINEKEKWISNHFYEMIQNNPHPNNILTKRETVSFFNCFNNEKKNAQFFEALSQHTYFSKKKLLEWSRRSLPTTMFLKHSYYSKISLFKSFNPLLVTIHNSIEQKVIFDFESDSFLFFERIYEICYENINSLLANPKKIYDYIGTNERLLEKLNPTCSRSIQLTVCILVSNIKVYCQTLFENYLHNSTNFFQSPIEIINCAYGVSRNTLKKILPDLYSLVIKKRIMEYQKYKHINVNYDYQFLIDSMRNENEKPSLPINSLFDLS